MATRIGPETISRIDAAWSELIAAVAGTGTISAACAKLGLSTDQIRVYRMARPEREKEWQIAREQSADYFADRVLEVANNPDADSGIARVRMDAYRWLASKRNPHVYSDKQTVNLNVKTVDLTRVIQDAQARLAAARQPRVIEGEVSRPQIAQAIESVALRAVEQSALAAHNAERDVDSLM